MPPYDMWLAGRADVFALVVRARDRMRGLARDPGRHARTARPRSASTSARPGGGHDPWALQVLEFSGGAVSELTFFLDTARLFPLFGLPAASRRLTAPRRDPRTRSARAAPRWHARYAVRGRAAAPRAPDAPALRPCRDRAARSSVTSQTIVGPRVALISTLTERARDSHRRAGRWSPGNVPRAARRGDLYGVYGGASPQPQRGTGACSTTSAPGCELPTRDPRAPFEVGDERRAELGIRGQAGVVGREAHQRREAKTLLGCDREAAVLGEHALVAAELAAVAGRAAEHLDPPGGDVRAMLLAHAAGEEPAQKLVRLDAVVERIDQPPEGPVAAGPFVERRHRSRF